MNKYLAALSEAAIPVTGAAVVPRNAKNRRIPDHVTIDQAVREWEVNSGNDFDPTMITRGGTVSLATIKRVMAGNTGGFDLSTYRALGRFLDRDPKCLWKHEVEPVEGGSEMDHALFRFTELIQDGKIPWTPTFDLRQELMLGLIPEMRVFRLSSHGWAEFFEHLVRQGHLFERFDGRLGLAQPTAVKLQEVVLARFKFELFLVDLFVQKSENDQAATIQSMKRAFNLCGKKLVHGEEHQFLEKEVQIHLCWCHENNDLRDIFAMMLKRSKQVGDLLLFRRAKNNEKSDFDIVQQCKGMPDEWEAILDTIQRDPKSAEPIKRLIVKHQERSMLMVDQLAIQNMRRPRC